MNRINAALDDADLHLDTQVMSTCLAGRVDPGDRWLRRVFNNGHTDFRHGGRLAGGFWMDLPKAIRHQAITIGGEPVVGAGLPRDDAATALRQRWPREITHACNGLP